MRIFLSVLLLGILSFPSFAATKNEDFPLQVHIVKVDMAQGQRNVSETPRNLPNSTIPAVGGGIHGGGSYLYHVYTVHVDGSDVEYKMTSDGQVLHIGDYKGHWNKNGDSVEIQFLNEKGKLKHQSFSVTAEAPLSSEQTSAGKQPNQ